MSLQVPLHDRFPSNQKCQKNCCNKKTVAIKNCTGLLLIIKVKRKKSVTANNFFPEPLNKIQTLQTVYQPDIVALSPVIKKLSLSNCCQYGSSP